MSETSISRPDDDAARQQANAALRAEAQTLRAN
jgi:hypothetical protein